jgi:hypothetical protein
MSHKIFYADAEKQNGLDYQWSHDGSEFPEFFYCNPQGWQEKTWSVIFDDIDQNAQYLICHLWTDQRKTDQIHIKFKAASVYDAKRQAEAHIKKHLAESAGQ